MKRYLDRFVIVPTLAAILVVSLGAVIRATPDGGSHRTYAQLRRPGGSWGPLVPVPIAVQRAKNKAVTRDVVIQIKRRWTFSGEASWYGYELAGNGTACGEVFDPEAMTAAHRHLPCGTWVLVRAGKRQVRVRINDRGPFIDGRVIDLSLGAFRKLAPPSAGTVQVVGRVE